MYTCDGRHVHPHPHRRQCESLSFHVARVWTERRFASFGTIRHDGVSIRTRGGWTDGISRLRSLRLFSLRPWFLSFVSLHLSVPSHDASLPRFLPFPLVSFHVRVFSFLPSTTWHSSMDVDGTLPWTSRMPFRRLEASHVHAPRETNRPFPPPKRDRTRRGTRAGTQDFLVDPGWRGGTGCPPFLHVPRPLPLLLSPSYPSSLPAPFPIPAEAHPIHPYPIHPSLSLPHG